MNDPDNPYPAQYSDEKNKKFYARQGTQPSVRRKTINRIHPEPVQENENESEEDVNITKYAQDTSLTKVLQKVIETDTQIDGLSAQLVERLEVYQQNHAELLVKIPKMEKELSYRKNEESKKMLSTRIAAHKKQLKMTESQIVKLKKHLEDLLQGSAQFKSDKAEFFKQIEDQRAENWLSPE